MSFYVQQDRGELVVNRYRPPTEIGFDGRVLGPLPPRMRDGYMTALRAVTEQDEEKGAPTVRLDFTVRRRHPVLVLAWENDPWVVVDNDGNTNVIAKGSDAIEHHTDVIEWTRALYGSLEPLTDDYVRYTAERSQWPESIAEAERRGLEPEEIELDAPPVAGNRAATSWRVASRRWRTRVISDEAKAKAQRRSRRVAGRGR
jgi:hypothetical protein